MSYFEGQTPPSWAHQHSRQQSWDPMMSQQQNSAPSPQQEDTAAFSAQFEEIDRASDNLVRTGKSFGPGLMRRDLMGRYPRQYGDIDQRHNIPRQVGENDGIRSHSAHSSTSVQGYYAAQRYGPRMSEADQMLQAKRRAAAQRERDLRNYHTEQQHARNLATAKSDRSMSPGASAMSDEDRRELIARQHRALYGDGSNLYSPDGTASRPLSQDARMLGTPNGGNGSSPLPFDGFHPPMSSSVDAMTSGPSPGIPNQRSPDDPHTSKSPNPSAFAMFENQQQGHSSSNTPEDLNMHQTSAGQASNNVGTIGSRPAQGGIQPKRNTPPTTSPLSFGYTSDQANNNNNNNADRLTPGTITNTTNPMPEKTAHLGWGATSGPWSSNKHPLGGVQASVWA